MTELTGTDHLRKVSDDIHAWLRLAVQAWHAEDHASVLPRQGDGSRGPAGPGDPTGTVATTGRRTDLRDQIGRRLLDVHQALGQLQVELTPRRPSRLCGCCGADMATHRPDHDGIPTLCDPCDRYQRRMRRPCDEATHDGRGQVRWCECPPACCDGMCADHVAPTRSKLSDRCAQRKARGMWVR